MDNTHNTLTALGIIPGAMAYLPDRKQIVMVDPNHFVADDAIIYMTAIPILKRLEDMTQDDAFTYITCTQEFGITRIMSIDKEGIYAEVQQRSISRALPKKKKHFLFNDSYHPERVKFLLKNRYDIFGDIDKGDALTYQQAEDLIWKDAASYVSEHAGEIGIYKNPVIAAAQIGCPFDSIIPLEDLINKKSDHDLLP